jgi:hypothetical protein
MAEHVVFDNNAYKRIAPPRLAAIIAAERKRGVTALASMAVLQELLARVRDPVDEQRGRNRAAIRKMAQHCGVSDGGKTSINFLSHTDCQVYRLLTGVQHPDDAERFDAGADLVRVISEASADDPLLGISGSLDAVQETVDIVESGYVRDLQQIAEGHAPTDSNLMKRNLEYAARIVQRTEAQYGVKFELPHAASVLVDVMKLTSIGFAVRDAVVAEIKAKKGGHGQHRNTVWDEEIVAATSMYTTIHSGTVFVVTEETRLLDAAASANASDRILNLVGYEKLLGLNSPDGSSADD